MDGDGDGSDDLRGADATIVRAALDDADPLPGTAGFAGRFDGRLLRDVLGRQPLFFEEETVEKAEGDEASDPTADGNWAFDPTTLESPRSVPAGAVVDATGVHDHWSFPEPPTVDDRDDGVSRVRAALAESVDGIGTDGPADDLAIAFSGGIDSAVLAARCDAPLYVAGFPDSHDVAAARSAAAALSREVTVVELDHETLVAAIPRVVAATGRANAMDVSIALPLVLTAERAAADGYDHLAVGQGADELFGGYAKVAKAPEDPRVDADTVAGARRETVRGLPGQLERDVLAIRSTGVEPVAPYLHDDVIAAALALPGEALVTDDGVRKWALRAAASEWLPEDVRDRDKKAMQYGSLVSREIDRLARQAGFKRRMDDHVGQYVASVCESSEAVPDGVVE